VEKILTTSCYTGDAVVSTAVIPAKAGIQHATILLAPETWTPAFAGVTTLKYRLVGDDPCPVDVNRCDNIRCKLQKIACRKIK